MTTRNDGRGRSPTTVRLATPGERPPLRTRGLAIAVVEGPDKGRAFQLRGNVARVGTGPENEILLTDPSVSRQHLTIHEAPDGYVLRDHGSTNGTRVNGVRTAEAHLATDGTVHVGSTALRLTLQSADERVTASAGSAFGELFGESASMRELFGYLERVSPTDLPVVLLGETGTGKELIARAIHAHSRRSAEPCVVFDCGAVEPSLIAAALFGQTAGAFTGAAGARKGAFASAHRGTLFLDEIGELPLDVQPKLLRALQVGEIQPLGSDSVTRVDVRVVSATHRDLEAMVDAGKFREDLFFRLAGLALEVPPLRARAGDVALLAKRFLSQAAPPRTLAPSALAALEAHAWPGNVRELKNVLDRAMALHPTGALEAEHLILGRARVKSAAIVRPGAPGQSAPVPAAPAPEPAAPAIPAGQTLEETERQAILAALKAAGGNKTQAAKALGISRQTLHDKLARYGVGGE